jgi:adenosylcobinamide kinase/adenosylcobinamide-phosphate guanylyltransferase
MARLTLVVGGTRSGKSAFAERLAATAPPVVYVATARLVPTDPEMAERIARHRQRRESLAPPWATVEEPWDVAGAVAHHASAGCVLVECVPLWLTNLLLGAPDRAEVDDAALRAAVAELAEAAALAVARVVLVSAEVGWGIVPDNVLARRFADVLGEANQLLAARADEVYACVAGIPWRLKPAEGPSR